MKKSKALILPLLFIFAAMLLACGTPLAEDDMDLIAKWRIDTWMRPRPKETVLFIIRGDANNPVLFLRAQGQETQIGELERIIDDAPMLARFVEVNGNRFIVMLVDPAIAHQVNGVLLYRSDPDFPDHPEKSRKAVSVLMDSNGMIVAPLGPDHAPEWTHLAGMILTSKNADEENAYERFFSPPIPISHLFQSFSLP